MANRISSPALYFLRRIPYDAAMRLFLWIVAGLLAAFSLLYYQIAENPPPSAFSGANVGGPFTLIDHKGQTVTDADYKDRYKLIYFGFTYCPAICPTELQKLTVAYTALPEATQKKIALLFVSVDPERDTPEVMKEYVSLFHPDLIGLTGTLEQIAQVKDDYKIYAAKVQDESMSDYTVDHSSYSYLMSPEGALLDVYKIDTKADAIEQSLKAYVK